jgi:hypothetical protein
MMEVMANDAGDASPQQLSGLGVHLPPIRSQQAQQQPRLSANPIYTRDYGYKAAEGEQDFVTNYQREYAKKSVTPVKQIRNDRMREEPGRFDGEPTYSHDYRRWTSQQSPRREKIVRPGAYAPPTGRFHGSSHYSTDYVPHVVTPFRKGQKPGDTARFSNGADEPFDPTTAYRQAYVRHTVPIPNDTPTYGISSMANGGGVTSQDTARKPVPILNEITNYQRDFTRKDIIKQASSKPKPSPAISDAPFDSTTTHKATFKRWTIERPYVHEHQPYIRPDGHMETTTTSRHYYDIKPVEKFVARRPPNTRDDGSIGPFDGVTSYSDQYRGRQLQLDDRARPLRRLGVLGVDENPAERAKFVGQATYRDEYPGHVATARQVPPRVDESGGELWAGGGQLEDGFDGRTVYRDQFVRYPSPERQQRREPVTWQPNTVAFNGVTNYSTDFTVPDATGARQQTFRPGGGQGLYNPEGASFDGTTTHRVDFQPYTFGAGGHDISRTAVTTTVTEVAEVNDDVAPTGDVQASESGQPTATAASEGNDHFPESIPPLEAPKFKGHANYGFEYEKWAQKQAEKKASAAAM